MDLTEEEKKLFRIHDSELEKSPSWHIENGLLQSYHENDEIVQITFGYIKRLLLEVAKKRGLDISSDIAFDMDEILKNIVKVPLELSDFDPLMYKSFDELNNYVQKKVSIMNSTEMERFFRYFNGIGGINDSFREFMLPYVHNLLANIDAFNYEIDENTFDDEGLTIEDKESDNEGEFVEIREINDEEVEAFQWDDFPDIEDDFQLDFEESSADNSQDNIGVENVSDEELMSYIKYLNSYPLIMKYKNNGSRTMNQVRELFEQTKLKEFYSDKDFYENFKKIMAHDTKRHIYHFHGTQDLESADKIIKEGLGMMRKDLHSTAYREFSMDELILYSRGFCGEIGRDAVVIIDEPVDENGNAKEIVELLSKSNTIHFGPSGLQGLNGQAEYIINPQYIVGYVDKKNKKVVFNERYYDYDKFAIKSDNDRPKDIPFSNERIAEGINSFNQSELETQENQKDS